VKLLENLIKIPSPSGFEEELAKFIQKELLQILPKTRVKVDFQNNVVAIIKGTSSKTVMIDAHLDQLGFIVTNIDRKGFISVQYIGGGDVSILSARNLVILTDKGKVNAIVNRKHSHLVEDESEVQLSSLSEAALDIGPRSKKKVQSIVKIGDPVVYSSPFTQLRESYYSGHGFDDKAGCFILMEAIQEIVRSKQKPVPTLVFTFSSQEETGGAKCKPLVKRYKPVLFIEVDVTFATDWEDDSYLEREVGKCELGKGLVLYRGVDIDKETFKLLSSVAKNNKIKVQYQAATGQTGYTPSYISPEEKGIRVLILGVPLRNMHTPVEIVDLRDLKSGAQLLTKFLLHKKLGKILEC